MFISHWICLVTGNRLSPITVEVEAGRKSRIMALVASQPVKLNTGWRCAESTVKTVQDLPPPPCCTVWSHPFSPVYEIHRTRFRRLSYKKISSSNMQAERCSATGLRCFSLPGADIHHAPAPGILTHKRASRGPVTFSSPP